MYGKDRGMDIRHFKYFVTVAKNKSFSLAAKSLAIAQPPLSRQIKDLEEELGVQLFDRSKKQIELTHSGKEFLEEAELLLKQVDRIKTRTDMRKQGRLGRLHVGIISSIATEKFSKAFRAFRAQNQTIELL